MTEKDIRWIQRFNNFDKALTQLRKFVEKKELNELELQGLIKTFEYTYELLLPYRMDLSIYHKIMDPEVKDHIDRVGQVFYER